MADKILERITSIKSVSKKKACFGKILAHLCKSEDDGMGSWSSEGLDEVLNSMKSENVIELADDAYKIKPNQDKNLSNDQNIF